MLSSRHLELLVFCAADQHINGSMMARHQPENLLRHG
jgi:hypothetical protein